MEFLGDLGLVGYAAFQCCVISQCVGYPEDVGDRFLRNSGIDYAQINSERYKPNI
jgi:hypothetical protein